MQALIDFLLQIIDRLWVWRIIQPDERGVRVTCGVWVREMGPGVMWMWPLISYGRILKVKQRTVDLPNQAIETLDRISMEVSVTLTYSINSVTVALLECENFDNSLATSTMKIVGARLGEINYQDATVTNLISACQRQVKYEGKRWGCEIHDIGITDLSRQKVIRLVNQ